MRNDTPLSDPLRARTWPRLLPALREASADWFRYTARPFHPSTSRPYRLSARDRHLGPPLLALETLDRTIEFPIAGTLPLRLSSMPV